MNHQYILTACAAAYAFAKLHIEFQPQDKRRRVEHNLLT